MDRKVLDRATAAKPKSSSSGSSSSSRKEKSRNPADTSAVSAAAAMPLGLQNFTPAERPSSRGGRDTGAYGERPGTRGQDRGLTPSVEGDSVMSSWGSSMFASSDNAPPEPPPEGDAPKGGKSRQPRAAASGSTPSSKREGGSRSKDKDRQSSHSSKASSGTDKSSRVVAKGAGQNDDGELEHILADIGGDSDTEQDYQNDEAGDAEFERWMQQDPDAEIAEPIRQSLSIGEDTGSGGGGLGSPDAEKQKKKKEKKKKDRTPEETEKKRGEIVDFYLERMVRELEKDVEAAPEDFYHLNFFCRKPLKEANSIIEKIFKRAWEKIEVEIRVMEIAQIEEQVQTEVALMMQKGGDDWRSHVQGGVIGTESPDATEKLQDEVATRQEPVIPNNGRRASSDLDEDYGPEDLANIMPPEDPLHALVAAHEQPRQHHSGAPADDDDPRHYSRRREGQNRNLPSTGSIKPAMARYALERLK